MSFKDLGLIEPLLKALAELGQHTPTPIQKQAIPAALRGRDIIAAAQTGTGKTAGFALPLIQLLSESPEAPPNSIHALVLVPRANWRSRYPTRSGATPPVSACVSSRPTAV